MYSVNLEILTLTTYHNSLFNTIDIIEMQSRLPPHEFEISKEPSLEEINQKLM